MESDTNTHTHKHTHTHHINDLKQCEAEVHHDWCWVVLDRSLQPIVVDHQVTVQLPLVHTPMTTWCNRDNERKLRMRGKLKRWEERKEETDRSNLGCSRGLHRLRHQVWVGLGTETRLQIKTESQKPYTVRVPVKKKFNISSAFRFLNCKEAVCIWQDVQQAAQNDIIHKWFNCYWFPLCCYGTYERLIFITDLKVVQLLMNIILQGQLDIFIY